MKKIMLVYPPGEGYQRGEDRCQINVDASVSCSIRACNDLGYCASALLQKGYELFLRDYPVERLSFDDFKKDFEKEEPDVLFVSTTNGSIFVDLDFISKAKQIKPDLTVILKGALFYNPENELYDELDLKDVDYLVGGEVEFLISELIDAHFNNKQNLNNIQGISYKNNGQWVTNRVESLFQDIDSIPFPARNLMKNELYINPATNKPLATIATSRGCPSSCIYCLSPIISGKNVRYRSPKSVYEELSECVNVFNITDFFFKSDTFTINKAWVIELCDMIINSELCGKINWAANSRANTVDKEMLLKMKKAGCSVIALGIESGSDESLKLMKKGTTVEQNRNAVKLVKSLGFQTLGFYLIGFPWETKEHLEQTKKLMFELNTDFMELSIATPFKGCELYNMLYSKLDNGEKVLGKDSFKHSTMGTDYISMEDLVKFRKDTLLEYHLRPSYIFKMIFNKKLTLEVFFNYVKYGFRLLKNILG